MGPERVAVGRVSRAHGVRGEVAVQLHTDFSERFAAGATLVAEDGTRLTVSSSRPAGVRLLVTFEGIEDRTAAESLRGQYLFVAAEELPELPEGEFWPHQIEGLEVWTADGRQLGRVAQVLQGPGNDVWEVQGGDGRVLVPAVRQVVASVDLDAGRITVHEEGLA